MTLRDHVERGPDGRYRIRAAGAVVSSIFPYQRSMKETLRARLTMRGGRSAIQRELSKAGAVLCMESALEHYSSYFRPGRICVYHQDPESLARRFAPMVGGLIPVEIYLPDIPLDGDTEAEGRKGPLRTTRWRTLVDLASDGKLYVARDLLEQLWGIVLE